MKSRPLAVLVPVFDDWDVLPELLRSLDGVAGDEDLDLTVVVVDDGSPRGWREALDPPDLATIGALRVVELRRNLGHQRALAVGLAWIHAHLPERTVLILDGDGEDDPRNVPALLARHDAEDGRRVVFAARRKRSESLVFQLCYRLYQMLHRVLTGRGIRVGNFSVVPPRAVARLVVTAETWSHYAAAVIATRVPHAEVATDRAQRLDGRSKMSFTALVVHGLSALSVYSHIIGVRLLAMVGALTALFLGGLAVAVAVDPGPIVAYPALSLAFAGLVALVLLQALVAATLSIFVLLAGRQRSSFLPLRDAPPFVLDVALVAGSDEARDTSALWTPR